MNRIQIEQLNNILNKLENFINDRQVSKSGKVYEQIRKIFGTKVENKEFEESEILNWIAECVSLFTEVNVNHVVIENFLNFLKLITRIEDNEFEKRIGPFVTLGWNSKRYWLSNIIDFGYTKIAFQCARANINKIIEEEKIVPRYIIDTISSNEKIKNLSPSLELLESYYQKKDCDGVIINTANLLDAILSLDNDLKVMGDSIGVKLKALIANKEKLKKFGISKDIVVALSSFRLIRNKKVVHKDCPIKYDIPFIVAVSFASLTIFFLESFILNSEFLKNKNI